VSFTQADAAVDEKRVVRLTELTGDGDARRVGEPVARADDEVLEGVVRAEDQGLILVVEHAARGGHVLAMEADGDEACEDDLRRLREGLLALALAEVELCRRGDAHLDDAVVELARGELVEPRAVEARVLGADDLEDFLPARGVEDGGGRGGGGGGFLRAAWSGLARWRRVGR